MRRWLWVLAPVGVLAAVLVGRALTVRSLQVPAPKAVPPFPHVDQAADRLAGALRIATVSGPGEAPAPAEALETFHQYLREQYPRVHATLSVESVAGGNLLYHWEGTDPALPPLLWLAHQDVVPAEATGWTHPPFSGTVADGFVWGRGALDDKASLLAQLEAVEWLLADGLQPRRGLYLAYGCDEEVGGRGAQAMAALLAERGVQPLLVLDEGLTVTRGMIPGIEGPVALLGVAEKGYLTLELVSEGEGGHAAFPPTHTHAGHIAAAVARLEAKPLPARLDGATRLLLQHLAPEQPFVRRLALANLWLFEPLVRNQLLASPVTAATVRTTTAVTQLQGSPRENVLPSRARAVVNFRVLPGQSLEQVVAHVRDAVDAPDVEVRPLPNMGSEPSAVSPAQGPVFLGLSRAVRGVFPAAKVAPALVVGATDARHYAGLSAHIYRFMPFELTREDVARVHGHDERLGVEAFAQAARFYRQLIREFEQPVGAAAP